MLLGTKGTSPMECQVQCRVGNSDGSILRVRSVCPHGLQTVTVADYRSV